MRAGAVECRITHRHNAAWNNNGRVIARKIAGDHVPGEAASRSRNAKGAFFYAAEIEIAEAPASLHGPAEVLVTDAEAEREPRV